MAGIGFELKKLFQKRGVFALLRAYGYAGIVCTGPMILGVVLLLGIHFISEAAGLGEVQQDLLTCMITYGLLASLVLTNGLAMVTTRYTADCLYEEKEEKVMPSFYGSISILLIVGGVFYGLFLLLTKVPVEYMILNAILFAELVVVWTEINYLTAIKDYKGILLAFFAALVAGLTAGYLLTCVWHFPIIPTLLTCVTVSYGIMSVWYYILLRQYFSSGSGSNFAFLIWLDKYPALFICGTCISIGMFAHLVLMWHSPIGTQIQGLYYIAAQYDVPALLAFLSTLVTTINFVTSVEVNFYPKYKAYFSLFNDAGSITDIEQAEYEMRRTLQDELSYTVARQVFVTIIFVVGGTVLLPALPLGFDEEMLGIFRVLCLGYAFYAAGNIVMLMSLYFADEWGACFSTIVFAVVSVAGTLFLINAPTRFYGFGFVVGAVCFMAAAIARLWYYQKRIGYYVLCAQPIMRVEKRGIFKVIAEKCIQKYDAKEEQD